MEEDYSSLIERFEENEEFYKKLYLKKCEGEEAYNAYIQTLDMKHILAYRMYVPGLVEPTDCFVEEFPIFNEVADIAVWKHSRYTPGFLHSHNYFEIVCVMSGTAQHYIEGAGEYTAKKGDIFVLPTGTRHKIESYADDCIIINIMVKKSTFQYAFFDTLAGNDVLSNFFKEEIFGDLRKSYLFFKTGDDAMIQQMIKRMFVESARHRKYHERIEKGLLEIVFAYILRHYEDYYVASQADDKIKIFKYLKEHVNDATLASAAEHFNYNPAYLSRLIHQSTGKTFSELRTQYRMDMAIRLLNESAIKINEVAQVVGYENVEQFNRQFKKILGVSPSQYRKQRAEQGEGLIE